jgi:cyclic lactone autoinducer peptide
MKKAMLSLVAAIMSIANLSLFFAANSASSIWNYQPKEPSGMNKYKK